MRYRTCLSVAFILSFLVRFFLCSGVLGASFACRASVYLRGGDSVHQFHQVLGCEYAAFFQCGCDLGNVRPKALNLKYRG